MGGGVSFYGLPSNYSNNAMYQYYMQMFMQQQQAMARQQQMYQQQLQEQQAQQQAEYDAYVSQQQATQQAAATQQASTTQPVQTVEATQPTQVTQVIEAAKPADGKDDGKIGFWGAVKNFGKGIGNFFKGMVCDENGKFSLGKTLKTVAIAAGTAVVCVATMGTAIPAVIAGAGVLMAGTGLAKGIYKTCTAKTDREAEAAWQDVGSGTVATALAVAGAKGAMKISGKAVPTGKFASIKAAGQCVKETTSQMWNAIRHPMQTTRAVAGHFKVNRQGFVGEGWQNLGEAFLPKNAKQNYIAAQEKSLNSQIAKTQAEITKLESQIAANPKATNVKSLRQQLNTLKGQKSVLESQVETFRVSSVADKIKHQQNYIADLKAKLETATSSQKTAIQAELKAAETILKADMNFANKVANPHAKMLKTEPMIAEAKAALEIDPNAATHLSSLNAISAGAKTGLFKQNVILAAKQNYQPVMSYMGGNLANAPVSTLNDARAQVYGFESLAQMQEVAAQNGVSAEQLADYIDSQFATQGTTAWTAAKQQADAEAQNQLLQQQIQQQAQQARQAATRAATQQAYTGYSNYASTMSNPFGGSGIELGFNDLYVSPYSSIA